MKPQILLLAFLVAALSSCTSMYKTGQTPDDVYFSPTRPQDEYAQVEKRFKNEVTIFVRPGTYTNVCVSKDGKLPGKNYLPGC